MNLGSKFLFYLILFVFEKENLKPEFDTKYRIVMKIGCFHHSLKPEFDTKYQVHVQKIIRKIFFANKKRILGIELTSVFFFRKEKM